MDFIANQILYPLILPLVVRGFIPDFIIRFGMRRLLQSTLNEQKSLRYGGVEKEQSVMMDFILDLKSRKIAESTEDANKQHYEVPSELYLLMLGPNLKYSSCYWGKGVKTLKEAEECMLDMVCERAEITSYKGSTPLRVLDLGCGWGSCGLYIAQHHPNTLVTMVSNSSTQREFILAEAKRRGLKNVKSVETMDANVMSFPQNSFDRIVSNEMFEHMKNYQALFKKVSSWLSPEGKMFVHIFVHDKYAYHFKDGWMAETFFTGGTMPSKDLLLYFADDFKIEDQWAVNGVHYSKTLEAWLRLLDSKRNQAWPILTKTYGAGNEYLWYFNWRLFYLACSELFRFNGGNEWYVAHYRFCKR